MSQAGDRYKKFSIATILLILFLTTVFKFEDIPLPLTGKVGKIENVVRSSTVPERKTSFNNTYIGILAGVPFAVHRCQDISVNETLDPDFQEDLDEFLAEVKSNGPTMGNLGLPIFRQMYILLQKLVKAPFVKTVCETGFNAGHSSFGWLRSNPEAQVYSFDIGTNRYAKPMSAYLQKKFPGRLHNIWGDSRQTIEEFQREHPEVKCDLILIDGGHYYSVVTSDFKNFREMANPVHLLIMDNNPDTRFKWMGHIWDGAKRRCELFEFFQCSYGEEDPEGMSFGRYAI